MKIVVMMLILLAAQPALAQDVQDIQGVDPVVRMPREVAGFRLGGTLAQARAACRAAGHMWVGAEDENSDSVCGGTATSVGHEAITTFQVCGLRVCGISIRIMVSGDTAVLGAVRDLRTALGERYGEAEYVFTGSPYCEEMAARGELFCIASRQGQFIWRYHPAGGGVFGLMVSGDRDREIGVWLHYMLPELQEQQDAAARARAL